MDGHGTTPAWDANPPRERLAAAVLRELARLTEGHLGLGHPSALSDAVADGSFAGIGRLDIDPRGNIVLVRVAEDERHLLKDGRAATPSEMASASEFHGGSPASGALPTSALGDDWIRQFGHKRPFVGTFRIPVREFLAMAREGRAILGNLGEGEILLSADAVGGYLADIHDRRTPERKLADEAAVIRFDI